MIKDYNLSDAWIQAMGVEDFKLSQKKPKSENPAIHKSEKVTQEIKQNSENKNIIPNFRLNQTDGFKGEAYGAYPNIGEADETSKNHKDHLKMKLGIVSRVLADNVTSLEELRKTVEEFDGCDLKKGAKNTVFSDGIPDSKIMLIGEAPGATEDEQGIPFCGESGKLLDNMLKTIGLFRDKNFYITNTIFWRPPANRTPTIDEIEICRPFVEKHIALIKPKLLILVGSTAVSSLLGANLQISKIRQEYYQYQNQYLDNPITTTALFHPAYLLRQPMQKKTTWYDLLRIKDYTIRI